MDFLRNFLQQIQTIWNGMSFPQKLSLGVAGLLALVLVGSVGFYSMQVEYRILYTDLAPEDSGGIVNKLQALGIPYRVAGSGTTVMVPVESWALAKAQLAAEGLPSKGGKGFELFDQTTLGMTPFTQHVNFTRALQGELAKTIMQIDPVVFARVHVVKPEPSPFLRDQKPTTASIMLKLKPGAALNRTTSNAIIAMVARGVEGLTRENVTLVDSSGRLLFEENNTEAGQMGNQMEYRRELENYLASKAESMLSQVLGPGRAIVRVTADLNMKSLKEKKETYSPEGKVVTSETITSNKSTAGGAGGKLGAVGASANMGKAKDSGLTGSSGSNNAGESIETKFAVSKITQEFEDKMGAVERLTIAALIDVSKFDPTGESKGEVLMDLADAQDVIKKAVGFKGDRDEIKVSQVRLQGMGVSNAAVEEEWQKNQQMQWILTMIRNASIGIASLIGLILGLIAFRRFGRKPDQATNPAPETADAEILRQLSSAIQQNPQAFTKVLATWLEPGEQQPPKAAA